MFGDTCKHAGSNFFAIVESENEISPTIAEKGAM